MRIRKVLALVFCLALLIVASNLEALRLTNPQTWEYTHANFNGGVMRVSLNDVPTDEASLTIDVVGPGGGAASAIVQFQDNGTVVIRIHEGLIKALVVNSGGTAYESP